LFLFPLTLLVVAIASGLGVLLGVLNVFVRDVGQSAQIALQLLFWFTPIVYPAEILPASIQRFLPLNPLFPLVEGFQSVLLLGQPPDVAALLWPAALAAALMALALYLFRVASPDMADVL
jgi:lipopolysaccharide transport system permease protein